MQIGDACQVQVPAFPRVGFNVWSEHFGFIVDCDSTFAAAEPINQVASLKLQLLAAAAGLGVTAGGVQQWVALWAGGAAAPALGEESLGNLQKGFAGALLGSKSRHVTLKWLEISGCAMHTTQPYW